MFLTMNMDIIARTNGIGNKSYTIYKMLKKIHCMLSCRRHFLLTVRQTKEFGCIAWCSCAILLVWFLQEYLMHIRQIYCVFCLNNGLVNGTSCILVIVKLLEIFAFKLQKKLFSVNLQVWFLQEYLTNINDVLRAFCLTKGLPNDTFLIRLTIKLPEIFAFKLQEKLFSANLQVWYLQEYLTNINDI